MYFEDIEELAEKNNNFREVLYTGNYAQLVLMNVPAEGDIGEEVHHSTDQVLVFTDGEGKAVVDGKEFPLHEGAVVFVPAGKTHNIINTGNGDLKLFTLYAPPEHKDGTIHQTKEEAQQAEEEH